jgi:hypothetical protein
MNFPSAAIATRPSDQVFELYLDGAPYRSAADIARTHGDSLVLFSPPHLAKISRNFVSPARYLGISDCRNRPAVVRKELLRSGPPNQSRGRRSPLQKSPQLKPAITRNIPGGSYEITKQLPERNGEFEYRIRSINEPHERVARESELQRS